MSPAEKALAEKGGPTFADLCDQMRVARMEELNALDAFDRAEEVLREARDRITLAEKAVDDANRRITDMIARECEVKG